MASPATDHRSSIIHDPRASVIREAAAPRRKGVTPAERKLTGRQLVIIPHA